MRIQAIREWINAGIIAIHFVPTNHNVADMLTKALPRPIIQHHRDILMMAMEEWSHPGATAFRPDRTLTSEVFKVGGVCRLECP